jgi:hypothetical protein
VFYNDIIKFICVYYGVYFLALQAFNRKLSEKLRHIRLTRSKRLKRQLVEDSTPQPANMV